MASSDLTQGLVELIKKLIRAERGNFSSYLQGTFVAAEVTDPLLSQVSVQGRVLRYVRKGGHIGTLVAGQQVYLMQGGGIPTTIVLVVAGNITKTG